MNKDFFLDNQRQHQVELFNAISYESERACVIVGAASIDAILGNLISKVLLPIKPKDCICSDDNSTFSGKITLAYQLGLIDKEIYSQLNILRRIRNDFSHKVIGCSLVERPHSDRYHNLLNSVSKSNAFICMPKGFPDIKVDEPNHVLQMKLIIVYLSSILNALEHFVKPIYKENLDIIGRLTPPVC